MKKRAKGAIEGIVQGVGFRPFIYQLALRHKLAGYVKNTSQGVDLEVEGPEEAIQVFFATISPELPPLASITSIEWREIPPKNEKNFQIKISKSSAGRSALISPDVCVCPDCLSELTDPLDRRYRYPFINCTNCGPRYTIIKDIPYDRPFTTMNEFVMCSACREEYESPDNRRFHAQPNACWDCGPRVALMNGSGDELKRNDPIKETISMLEQGSVLAIKGLGGYHLAVDASNNKAVKTLRMKKHREEKPLALMVRDLECARKIVHINNIEEELLTSKERPIVLLKKRVSHGLSSHVAPKNKYFGLMLPYTPLHYLLMEGDFRALVMTSGNMVEEPINITNNGAFENLGEIADCFLTHNREIYLRSDDSILRVTDGKSRQIRRSRGYVPVPIFLSKELEEIPSVLAVGCELKNTVCLTKKNRAFVSQHIGDMENLETLEFFNLTVSHLKRILEITPEIMVHDHHPDYLSSKFAKNQDEIPTMDVQHHHAHVASCMAEHGMKGPVIGISLDGTGMGLDGNIWGGEILVADLCSFRRAAHLEYVALPGGDAAAKFPWRMALAYLDKAYGDHLFDIDIPCMKTLEKQNIEILTQMIRKKINSPLTSSCGRLFDAIASIAGIRNKIAYEGQAAIELEMARDHSESGSYPWQSMKQDNQCIMLTSDIVRGVVDDVSKGEKRGVISSRFHNTLIRMFSEMTATIRDETGIGTVVLSGGSFQNLTLLGGISSLLKTNGFDVFSHSKVPTNDGGISLGQAVCAGAKLSGFEGKF
ncbi:carbamoyltransferase HypF [Thermodesulfobacteriota bacterium]